jgi:hypothetical protein
VTEPADTLAGRLLSDPARRPVLLSACERLIDDEVSGKGGLTGLAIKAAYRVVCAMKPGIIRELMDGLADDFVRRLEPLYAQHRAAGGKPAAFGDFLSRRAGEAAEALLGITDERASRARNATLKGAYERLRPSAKKHVEEAIPRVGRTLSPLL